MADEDGFASPFDDDLSIAFSVHFLSSLVYPRREAYYIFAFRDSLEIDLNLCLSKNVCRCGYRDEEIYVHCISFDPLLVLYPAHAESDRGGPMAYIVLRYEPCTVAFAPAAVNAPIVPTIKY